MPVRTAYTHGTPSWVDLATPDAAAAKAFYTKLFGWEYHEEPTDQGTPYVLAMKSGLPVAGMMQSAPESEGAMPTMWSTYVSVDDLEAVVAKVEAAGGAVIMGPMDVMDAGRMAVIGDPTGAVLCLWAKKEHAGAGLVNEHGALCWNEEQTSDVAAAAAFYETVLGWTASTMSMGEGFDYTIFNVGDDGIAGALKPPMEGVPAHWSVVFAVDDTDATVAIATAAGATVLAEPFDLPVGRLAVLSDPAGAVFQVIQLAATSS